MQGTMDKQKKEVSPSLPPHFSKKYEPDFETCSTEDWNKNEMLPDKQPNVAVYSRFWLRQENFVTIFKFLLHLNMHLSKNCTCWIRS